MTYKFLDLTGLKQTITQIFSKLKAVALSGSYTDLINRPTIVNNGTTTTTNTVLDGRMGKTLADKDANLQSQITSLNSALEENLNQNRLELTNSSYYPAAICYRSGQVVYMKCAGILAKEVPADAPYVVGIESMMPEEYRPNADITAYPNISFAGKNIKVEIKTTGRVIFTSPETLPIGFGLNMHFTYMTGKSNF